MQIILSKIVNVRIQIYIYSLDLTNKRNMGYFFSLETETFEATFNEKLRDSNIKPREREILDNLNNDNNLKRFSFLNRWCIFQKQV